MVGTARFVILLSCGLILSAGCHSGQRVTPPPASRDPQAILDLLRVQICSEESITLSDGRESCDVLRQAVSEAFADLGFHIIDVSSSSPCPDYGASDVELGYLANQRDIDMYVLFRARAKQYDKFGEFYNFEAEARGKVAQVSDKELLTTKSVTVRGKREHRESVAAESALAAAGQELAGQISQVILEKSGKGALLRRLRVTGLRTAAMADYVRTGLSQKPGIHMVILRNWDETTGTALFWIRVDPSAQENLAAYLEELPDIRLRVERLDKTDVETRRRGLLD